MQAKNPKVSAEGTASQAEESSAWAIARRERDRIAALGSLACAFRGRPDDARLAGASELDLPVAVRAAPRNGGARRHVGRLKWLYTQSAHLSKARPTAASK